MPMSLKQKNGLQPRTLLDGRLKELLQRLPSPPSHVLSCVHASSRKKFVLIMIVVRWKDYLLTQVHQEPEPAPKFVYQRYHVYKPRKKTPSPEPEPESKKPAKVFEYADYGMYQPRKSASTKTPQSESEAEIKVEIKKKAASKKKEQKVVSSDSDQYTHVRAPRKSTLKPKSEPEPELPKPTVWLGRTKEEVLEDKRIIAARNARKEYLESLEDHDKVIVRLPSGEKFTA